MDVSQYLEIFVDETKEHLQSLNEQMLIIENEPENTDTINEIFRAAHSLKGMAGTMGFKRMQKLTHQMENVFSEIRNGNMKVDANLVDVLFQCLDALEEYLDCIQESSDEGTNDNEPILKELEAILNGKDKKEESKKDKEEEKSEGSADDDTRKYKELTFAEFEKHAIQESFDKGMRVYVISVQIEENCLLKAARAFLVFKSLESIGEVIKSQPVTQDIEDEKFDQVFSICVITEEDFDRVITIIKSVSEIKDAIGEEITKLEDLTLEDKEEKKEESSEAAETTETAPAVENQKSETVPAVAAKDNKKPAAKSKTGGKPVVNRSVRVDIEKLDLLMNLVSELIIAKNGLISASSDSEGGNEQTFNEQIEYLERVTTNLHESVMKVRMMPIETVTTKFPRMIRDLSKKLGKEMQLFMTGEDTELDRTVIDEIGDPLMHLLRNSADHGLETADIRVQRGKPEVGTVKLDAYQDGNNVVIEVSDDGNGINVEGVKNSAINKGTITAEQAESMTDKEIIDLLFRPSFSTAKKITDVSGRGVGLDVVKTKIEALGGDIEVKTKLGEGSTFVIRLPLTLAIIQALMVELGDEKYAISIGSIQTIEDIPVQDIKYVQTKEVIHLRGTVIPIIRLAKVLDIEQQVDNTNLTVIIVKKGDKLAGLVVDRLVGQQEIVIKSLGKYIRNNSKIISGATILGNGDVALIIDVNTLL